MRWKQARSSGSGLSGSNLVGVQLARLEGVEQASVVEL